MHFFKEEFNWNKLFICLFVIVAIIIIIVIWVPKKKFEISTYTKLDIKSVDKFASEEYIGQYIKYIDEKNLDNLFDKVSSSYLSYKGLDRISYDKHVQEELNYSNIHISNVQRIKHGNYNIYRVLLNRGGQDRYLNIVERYPKEWFYTFDDFYDFKVTNFSKTYNDIKFSIDSIYQTFDHIEITCYIENRTADLVDIHLEQEDSIILKLSNNEIVELSNSQIDQKLSQVESNSFSSRTLKFNVDLENQQYIEQIIFNNIELNGEKGKLTIDIDI